MPLVLGIQRNGSRGSIITSYPVYLIPKVDDSARKFHSHKLAQYRPKLNIHRCSCIRRNSRPKLNEVRAGHQRVRNKCISARASCVYLERWRYLVERAVVNLGCRISRAGYYPVPVPSRKLPVAEIDELGGACARIADILGQPAWRIEVVLPVGVAIGGKGLVTDRVSVIALVAPVVHSVLRHDCRSSLV